MKKTPRLTDSEWFGDRVNGQTDRQTDALRNGGFLAYLW